MGDYTDMTGEPAKPSGAVFKWGRGGASRVEEYADLSESQPTINASRMGSAPRPESKEAADPATSQVSRRLEAPRRCGMRRGALRVSVPWCAKR